LKSSIRSVILIGSSLPIHLGERAIKRGNRRGLLWGIAIGWVMGAVFLIGHFAEYATSWKEFRPSTNAYGSAFYTITGLHALHLMVGLVVLAYLWYRALRGHYDEHNHEPVQCGVLYWHFVDAVWIFVFSSLYLSVAR
jgi:heme/copper-type cytochrome/quinol oxidase subunit 3